MAHNVSVYKGVVLLGTGSMNGATISSYSASNGRVTGSGRNVQITATSGNNVGASICTTVLNDGGTTLTVEDATPYT